MVKEEVAKTLIYQALDEINKELPAESKVNKEEATVLFGINSVIDSLTTLNLMQEIERLVKKEVQVRIAFLGGHTDLIEGRVKTVGELTGLISRLE